MNEYVEFKPKSFPTDLLKKEFSHRKFYLREKEIELAHKLHDMDVREDDIWLVTLPHSGDKLMQEILWLILNNYNFEGAKKVDVKSRNLEINDNLETTLNEAEHLNSPRLISTFLPLHMLPSQVWRKKPKLIYVYRDPKDAHVSFCLNDNNIDIGKAESYEELHSAEVDKSSSFEHVAEFYALRDELWVYYTSFERMVSNLFEVITNLIAFLEKSITDKQMEHMLQYFSDDGVKNNSKSGFVSGMEKYFRKIKRVFRRSRYEHAEKIGISKKELSPELYAKYEEWIVQELTKYNVTLNELLLIDNDANQNHEELNEKSKSNNDFQEEENKSVETNDNTESERKDNSEANTDNDNITNVNHSTKNVKDYSNEKQEVENKNYIIVNEKGIEKKYSTLTRLTEEDKTDASNLTIIQKENITDNDFKLENKEIKSNDEDKNFEGIDNENVESEKKGCEDDEKNYNKDINTLDSKSNQNVELKDIKETDKATQKDNKNNDMKSTYL